jgi:pimeloyl-ACP methyl ester carboxylesterase
MIKHTRLFKPLIRYCFVLSIFLQSCSYYSASDQLYISSLKADKTFYRWETSAGNHCIHYLEKGSGTKHLILLHGYAANTYSWHHQIDFFASKGYHVWAIDLLGFGFSDKPTQNYSLDLYRTQVLDFMDHMEIDQAHLMGHSMGGAICLSIAATAPNRLLSLTLIAPAAYPIDLPFPLRIGKRLGNLSLPFYSKKLIRRTLSSIFFDYSKITEEQVDAYWLPYRSVGGREAALAVLETFDQETFAALAASYQNIRTPTFIVWGDKDKWISPAYLESFKIDIPHAKQLLLPNCGHAPQEEQPEAVNDSLLNFMNLCQKTTSLPLSY